MLEVHQIADLLLRCGTCTHGPIPDYRPTERTGVDRTRAAHWHVAQNERQPISEPLGVKPDWK